MYTLTQVALAVMGRTGLRGDDLTSSTVLAQMPRTESQQALAVLEARPLLRFDPGSAP